jgi:hypothetical protein
MVQRTIPLSAGIPLVLVDANYLAKTVPSAKTAVFMRILAKIKHFSSNFASKKVTVTLIW